MDNRIFNVNGEGAEMLLKTLELVFEQEGENTRAKAWKSSKEHGLILFWYTEGSPTNLFPAPMSAKDVLPQVLAWLKSDDAKAVAKTGWDGHCDHDGSNGVGWRVYCEDWGHVGGNSAAICAIKPVVLWYGK